MRSSRLFSKDVNVVFLVDLNERLGTDSLLFSVIIEPSLPRYEKFKSEEIEMSFRRSNVLVHFLFFIFHLSTFIYTMFLIFSQNLNQFI